MNLKNISILISWTAVLCGMLLIFFLSSQPGKQSDQLSEGVAKVIVEAVEKVNPKANFNMSRLNHLLRKNAHFFAYLILGILVMVALWTSGVSGKKGIVIALCVCILYAISDEVHQLYVPGRGGQVKDVLLDSVGAMVGIGLYEGIREFLKKRIL